MTIHTADLGIDVEQYRKQEERYRANKESIDWEIMNHMLKVCGQLLREIKEALKEKDDEIARLKEQLKPFLEKERIQQENEQSMHDFAGWGVKP